MKKLNIIIITLIILSLIVGCTTESGNGGTNNGTSGNETEQEAPKPDPVVTKEVPESYPKDLVPLYGVETIEGIITQGDEYFQVYYTSDESKENVFEHYSNFFKEKNVEVFENEYLYEFRGTVDDMRLTMNILSPENTDKTSVIIFLYKE